jgi:hypothetical protein
MYKPKVTFLAFEVSSLKLTPKAFQPSQKSSHCHF